MWRNRGKSARRAGTPPARRAGRGFFSPTVAPNPQANGHLGLTFLAETQGHKLNEIRLLSIHFKF
jgi:hypothetical protein